MNFCRKNKKAKDELTSTKSYHLKDLLTILKHYIGLFGLKLKVPIKDQYSLALVYTPGVGKSCMEIKSHPELAYTYTNKANSIIILTDSSEFTQDQKQNWHNLASVPFIEAKCVYYKLQANIDAYPIVLDLALIKNEDDILEILDNLSPAYAGFELLHISNSRLTSLLQKYEKNPFPGVLITSEERKYLEEQLKANKILDKVHVDLIIACAFRAALDSHSHQRFPKKVFDGLAKYLACKSELLASQNYFKLATATIRYLAQALIDEGIAKARRTSEDIEHQFLIYLLEGSHGWIDEPDKDNITLNHSIDENSLDFHKRYKGMIEVEPKIKPRDPYDLINLFSPEKLKTIAHLIRDNPEIGKEITCKANLCAIITNGTAILGFGDIGPTAGLPVMEGKSCLFKQLGGIDLMPICIKEKNPEKVVDLVHKMSPIISMINLEDIKAPECFDIEDNLSALLDFPVFHDDQHGTAIICLAGIINSLKLAKKKITDMKIIINGAGAAGISIAKILLQAGAKTIIVCDTEGAIYTGRPKNMNRFKERLAGFTNSQRETGTLKEVIKGTDIFIGVSAPGAINEEMIKSMAEKPIIFALANPIPEVLPDVAKAAGAFIVGTGRSDFPNQINNSLVFPGLFRGCLDIQAKKVTMEMKIAAAESIASILRDEDITVDRIIPGALDLRVPQKVAKAVADAGIKQNIAQKRLDPFLVEEKIHLYLLEGMLRSYDPIPIQILN